MVSRVMVVMIMLVLMAGFVVVHAETAEQILNDLASEQADVRSSVPDRLVRLGESGISAIQAYAREPANPNRAAAIAVLGRFDAAKVESIIIGYAKSGDRDQRSGAATALGYLGSDKAGRVLRKMERSERDVMVRSAAVQSLGYFAGEKTESILLRIIDDPDESARPAAARALGILGNRDHVGKLIYALRADDPELNAAAAFALGKMKTTAAMVDLGRMLASENSIVMEAAAEALREFGPKSIDTLRGVAQSASASTTQKIVILGIISDLGGSTAEETVLELLTDESVPVRLAAIKAIQELECRNCLPRLTAAAHDPSRDVRLATLDVLAKLAGSDALSVFTGSLTDKDPALRIKAVEILNQLVGIRSLSYIKTLLIDADESVVETVIDTMTAYGKDIIPEIRSVLTSIDASLRSQGILLAGRIEGSEMMSDIVKLLRDPDGMVRLAALDFVERFGGSEEVRILEKQYYRSKTDEAKRAEEVVRTIKARL